MASVRNGTNEIHFEKLFLTKKGHLKICRLSQIISRERELGTATTRTADNSPYLRPGHTSMKNFLQIADPCYTTNLTLIPGAHTATDMTVLGAWATENPVLATDIVNAETGQDRGHRSYKVYFDYHDVPQHFAGDPIAVLVASLDKHDHEIPFALISDLTLVLLKHGYAQAIERTGHLAYVEFTTFATAIALDWMLARFQVGSDQRKFVQCMNLLDKGNGVPDQLAAASDSLKSWEANYELNDDVNPARKWSQGQSNMIWLLVKNEVINKDNFHLHDRFDSQGRRFISKLLSILLQELGAALIYTKLCRPARGTAATCSKTTYEEALKDLQQATEFLSSFVQYFREVIGLTLKWVAHVCSLKNGSHGQNWASSKEVAGLGEIERDPKCGWHDGFLYWLQLFVADFSAIQDIHPWALYRHSSPRLASHQAILIPKAQIHTLQVECSPITDDRLPTMDEVLDDLLRLPEHKAALKARPESRCTMHSETILLSLYALTMDGMLSKSDKSPLNAQEISNCLKTHDIEIPADLFEQFRTVGEVMSMSPRCCPVCRILLDRMYNWQPEARRRRVARLASHGELTSVALPPWTLRAIAEPVLRILEQTVQDFACRAYRREQDDELWSGQESNDVEANPTPFSLWSPFATETSGEKRVSAESRQWRFKLSRGTA